MNSNERLKGIGKDILIIVFAFLLFAFFNLRMAVLVGTVCTAVLLIRRFAFDLNPLSSERKIIYNGKEILIPSKVEVFEVKDSLSFESLLKYVQILQSIAIPPRILIIRFYTIFYLRQMEFHFLNEILKILNSRKIVAVLSDVDESIMSDLERGGIVEKIGLQNIAKNLINALSRTEEILEN